VFLLKGKSKTFVGCFTASPASGKRQEEKHATLNPNVASLFATPTPLEFITNPLLNLFDRCHSGAFADYCHSPEKSGCQKRHLRLGVETTLCID
jgi:hypothetical protein